MSNAQSSRLGPDSRGASATGSDCVVTFTTSPRDGQALSHQKAGQEALDLGSGLVRSISEGINGSTSTPQLPGTISSCSGVVVDLCQGDLAEPQSVCLTQAGPYLPPQNEALKSGLRALEKCFLLRGVIRTSQFVDMLPSIYPTSNQCDADKDHDLQSLFYLVMGLDCITDKATHAQHRCKKAIDRG